MDNIKKELESDLREKYGEKTRQELKSLHPIDSYVSYYKKFGYTYHVLPQLESVARGKTIPSVSPLVEAMFIAELKNMLLTAGHDLEKIKRPLTFANAPQEIEDELILRHLNNIEFYVRTFSTSALTQFIQIY